MKRWMMVCLVLCAGCPSDELTTCGDRVCADGQVCLDNVCRYCGNGRVDHVAGDDGQLLVDEECDVATDANCDLNCTFRRCGNGFVGVDENGAPEQCDDGNAINNDTCDNNCTAPACGNGVVAGTEECDDGTVGLSGDGCSSACVRESEYWLEGPGPQVPPRAYAAVAVDTDRKRVVVFGGIGITGSGGTTGVVDETWEWDGRTWTERFPKDHPSARARAMMAYDPIRHVTVLFGGTSASSSGASPQSKWKGDTWEWDGTDWVETTCLTSNCPPSPLARVGGVMAYDAIGGGVIVQGGDLGGDKLSDTWRYTGSWTDVTPMDPMDPSPFSYGAAAVAITAPDGVTRVAEDMSIVMLDHKGLVSGNEPDAETWIWNGSKWSALDATSTAARPSARIFAGFAFDPQRQVAVLFGGQVGNDPPEVLSDVWEWNAVTRKWSTYEDSPGIPTGRYGMQFAFDPTIARGTPNVGPTPFVMWGGDQGSLDLADELWTGYSSQPTDQRKWIPMSRERLPLRVGAAATFDALRGEVIAYGGGAGGRRSPLDGTSGWDGTRWYSLPAAKEPGPMAFAAATFDRGHGRTVLFGYRAQEPGDLSEPSNTLWSFNEGAWTRLYANGAQPAARDFHAMVYDERHHQVLVFGGTRITSPNTEGSALGDLWALDEGGTWSKLSDAPSGPTPRKSTAMAFDPHGHDAADPYDVLLFGGYSGGPLGDTWLWNGQTWTQAHPETSPPARNAHKLVYDERLDSLVLFGGSTSGTGDGVMNDLWRWDRAQATWIQIPVSNAPEPMMNHSMVYDPIRDEVVVFGGRTADNSLSAATWTFRSRSPTPIERCDDTDADGDGLVSCDDPDCRAQCEPVCRATETTCDPMRPRCGDGQCSALEDGALCPVDCYCGDGLCMEPEDPLQCPVDCYCGDGLCMEPEDSGSCPADCQ